MPPVLYLLMRSMQSKSRDSHYGGGNDEREQTLNQLLAEMDGFDTSKGLLILAATNRPEVLDPALFRPGRFDRRVIVDRPDLKGRVEILKVHAKDVLLDETVDLDAIALATSGAVGSDLANMINEAAILAVKNGRKAVSQKDLLESVEVVLVGKEKKDRILSPQERKIVSYHEVGHALLKCSSEGRRACTEDYDRTPYHGSAGLRYACSGGRKIPQYSERTGSDAGWISWRPGCRGDRV